MVKFQKVYTFLLLLLCVGIISTQAQTNVPPDIDAVGDQVYCPQSEINVVTSFNIIDPDDTNIEVLHIQISQGYENGQDLLSLTGAHPNIQVIWNAVQGKLSMRGAGGTPANYVDLIAAVQDVVFSSSSANVSGEKYFSFTVGDANYLPSTDHYYEYVPMLGVTWTNAKTLAEGYTYFGLQGYLATINSQEEAVLSGEQAAGTGWIGGSDEDTEGAWKWMTGPEAGTIFWNGGINGSTPTGGYANWNTGEPNNLGNEDYAHVTAPNIGTPGSWNDLPNAGSIDPTNPYHPMGFIVEYGGMPGDPVVDISGSTKITVPEITTIIGAENCGAGALNLEANGSVGDVLWFDVPTGGVPIFTGTTFTTPLISATTTYYVLASGNGCTQGNRVLVTATINALPTVNTHVVFKNCDEDGIADGFTDFNLTEGNDIITNGNSSGLTFTYYENLIDAQTAINSLNPVPFNNSVSNTVYVRVENSKGCYSMAILNLQVSTTSFSNGYLEELSLCDDDAIIDGIALFDLTQASQQFLNQFPSGQNLTVQYFRNLQDAQLEQNVILNETNYANETAFSQIVHVRVESNDNGECFGIGPHLQLTVHPRPQFELDPSAIYCIDGLPITLQTYNALGNYTYVWTDARGDVVSTGPTANIEQSGIYTVVATSSDICDSLPKTVDVMASGMAILVEEDIAVNDFSINNSISIDTSNLGIGDYEFSLDNQFGPYQDAPFFDRVIAGDYVLYVRDKNGCGVSAIDVFVLGYPKFFTPNEDGYNDYWNVKGWNDEFTSNSKVKIFNRYGKLLKEFSPITNGWNGTSNGYKLPTSDYWFIITLYKADGTTRVQKGHFSLVR